MMEDNSKRWKMSKKFANQHGKEILQRKYTETLEKT